VHDDDPLVVVVRTEWREAAAHTGEDRVVREEPLEIRIGGVPIAVVMRTPGHDEELVTGFLLTERIVDNAAQIESVRHCTTVDTPEAEDNVIQAVLRPGVTVDVAALRRNLYASSSCGVCGKASIDQAMACAAPLHDDVRVSVEQLYALPDRLRDAQLVFAQTGGLHAAGLFDAAGRCIAVREDVGRHNAVDKVVGLHARQSEGDPPVVVMVSGRVSFEIAQKALAARIPIVAAVSAPSSLAVELARRSGLTLVGFLRDRRLCVYAGEARVVAAQQETSGLSSRPSGPGGSKPS
jgi:FdhD protein